MKACYAKLILIIFGLFVCNVTKIVFIYVYRDKSYTNDSVNTIGSISIVSLSIIYWLLMWKIRCQAKQNVLADTFPRFAFIYALGLGILSPFLTEKIENESIHIPYFPIVFLSLMTGYYIFEFLFLISGVLFDNITMSCVSERMFKNDNNSVTDFVLEENPLLHKKMRQPNNGQNGAVIETSHSLSKRW